MDIDSRRAASARLAKTGLRVANFFSGDKVMKTAKLLLLAGDFVDPFLYHPHTSLRE
jgi:hypothetical protein